MIFAEQCVVFYRMTIRKHHPTNAIGKSRDAKFCVSRGGICDYCQAYYWMSILLWHGRETQDFASLPGSRHWVNDEELKAICAACNSRDAKSCVSRGGICDYCQHIIAWVYRYKKDGRRKILRLYWAYAIEWMMRSIRMICAGCNSRDAKSCVSREGICDYCQAYYWMSVLLWEGRETQDFASLPGSRHWVNDEELKAICAACNSRDAKSCVSQANTELILITDASAARIYIMA